MKGLNFTIAVPASISCVYKYCVQCGMLVLLLLSIGIVIATALAHFDAMSWQLAVEKVVVVAAAVLYRPRSGYHKATSRHGKAVVTTSA